MNKKIEDAKTAYKDLVTAKNKNDRTKKALGSNIPKHKVKRYKPILVASTFKFRAAQQKFFKAFNKLTSLEKSVLNEDLRHG